MKTILNTGKKALWTEVFSDNKNIGNNQVFNNREVNGYIKCDLSLWYKVIKPLKFIVSTGYKAVHRIWYKCTKINKPKLIWRKILESLILKYQKWLLFSGRLSDWNYFCICLFLHFLNFFFKKHFYF